MSNPFDRPSGPGRPGGPQRPGGPGPRRPRPASRRPGALVITVIVLIVAFMLLSGFASFWTERLWFGSLGYREVFTTLLLTRVGLFLVFAGLMAATIGIAMAMAYRFRPVLWPGMPGTPDDGMDRYRELLSPRMGWVIGGAATVMGLFAGASATGQWRSYSLWRHSQSFGTTDPYFKKDVGFYVFELPFWHYVVDYFMALAVVGLMASVLVNYVFGGIRLSARPGERLTSAVQIQVSALLAMFVLAKAVDYWLDRYDLVTNSGSIFTGMGYTDDKAVLPAKEILAGIAVVCAILFLANVWRRTWLLPSVGVALFALSAIILGLIVPTVVQAIRVNPNVPDREGLYIQANIDATRTAYGLDQVETTSVDDTPVSGGGKLADLDEATSSVPLVDPKIVSEVFEQQQQVRAYYSVSDVLDVDRYEIDGTDRAVVLGVRELDQQGIDAGDRNWNNLHTVYTHGDGVIAAYANQRPEDDSSQSSSIQWAEGQEASQDDLTSLSGDGVESRVYYGETSPDYSVVGKPADGRDVELVLPSDEDAETPETTYDGKGGVPVGSLFHKLLYAVKFSEPNFLLAGRVNENSKVLYDRNPRSMVEKVAPWLTVDSDPYPVVVDGRIQWVLDGYTVTDKYPLSQRESLETMTDDSLQQNDGFQTLPTDEVNYVRNSVKATVDAYDGTVTLYAWDDQDPILKAWDEVFPGLIKDRDQIPDALLSHLRYPEDLFKAQRYQFQRYHETSAKDWFEGSTRWVVPKDPTVKDSTRLQPPYRFFIDEDGKQTWSLTSVYVPRERETLVAYMSVNSDATDEENYGKISVRELPNARTDGPVQIAAALSTDETVRQELLSFTNGDAEPIFGNLLTLPIDNSFMYVQPLYTRRDSESAFPVLSFVLVSYQGRVGIGETLRAAIQDSLDGVVATPETPSGTPTPSPSETPTTSPSESPSASPSTPAPGGTQAQIRDLLRQAEAKFAQADAAQAAGNTVKWARLMEEGRDLIEQAVRLAG